MTTMGEETLRFTQDAIDELLAQFDGDGPKNAADAESFCAAFDAWIVERSADRTVTQGELDRFRAEIWFMRGTLANDTGAVDDALGFFRGSIDRAARAKNVNRQILSLRSIARCYEYAGMQAESTRCIFEALDLAEEQGDDRTIGLVLHGLSALYDAQGAYEQVLESAHRTREIAERINDTHLLVRAYGALSLSCGFLDRAEEGLVWMQKALQLCTDAEMQQSKTALTMNQIFLYQRCGRLDDAVALAAEQVEMISDLSAMHAASIYVDVAEVNVEAGNLSVAVDMLARADEAIGDSPINVHLLRYYIVAADLYEAQGQQARALEMMRLYVEKDREIRGREAQARLVIAERHFAAELASKTEELHHLRTVELVEKNNQLSDLIQQKDEILHVVVHDLRNPLAAAQLLGESLLIDLSNEVDEDAVDRLQSIGQAAIEMRATIDTLVASQETQATSTPAPVAIAVQLAVDDARKMSANRNIMINETITEVDLIVNSALLRRSLDDLLWNAVESSKPDMVVDVCVGPIESGGARITIAGDHIRFDEQFEDGRNLYIARRLIERMHGSITLSSSPNDARRAATIDLRA